jgi:uncharacterized protein
LLAGRLKVGACTASESSLSFFTECLLAQIAGSVDHPLMHGCEIAVRLQPRARAAEILGEREGALLVRVTAPPVEGRANDALCRLIAKRAGVGVRRVSVVRGASSREKVVRVEGIGAAELRRRLTRTG